ncbi:MAG: DUF4846 domain-containing protein [Hyphomicrobiaceae bacterium]
MQDRWLVSALVLLLMLAFAGGAAAEHYAWRSRSHAESDRLDRRFMPPEGFVRITVQAGSFAAWLRGLPLKPPGTPVLLHTGGPKWRQDVHAAVIDIDTGARDLQQCADAVMRLRAEWQFARGKARRIAFNDTGGRKPMPFSRWAAGERPRAEGRGLVWVKRAPPDASYASFRRYMDTVFTWAGTHSLERELAPVADGRVEIGDVIIKGGFPGHAVLVADVVEHPGTGERRFLLIQSFMPAQDMHVLKGRDTPDGSPWFRLAPDQPFVTPEWIFPPGSLRRWAIATSQR